MQSRPLQSRKQRAVNTTLKIVRDLATPALDFTAGYFAADEARAQAGTGTLDSTPTHDAFHALSAVVVFSALQSLIDTVTTGNRRHMWNQLSTEQKIFYGVFLLLAAGSYAYALTQVGLNHPSESFWTTAAPAAAAGSMFATVANRAAKAGASSHSEHEDDLLIAPDAPRPGV